MLVQYLSQDEGVGAEIAEGVEGGRPRDGKYRRPGRRYLRMLPAYRRDRARGRLEWRHSRATAVTDNNNGCELLIGSSRVIQETQIMPVYPSSTVVLKAETGRRAQYSIYVKWL